LDEPFLASYLYLPGSPESAHNEVEDEPAQSSGRENHQKEIPRGRKVCQKAHWFLPLTAPQVLRQRFDSLSQIVHHLTTAIHGIFRDVHRLVFPVIQRVPSVVKTTAQILAELFADFGRVHHPEEHSGTQSEQKEADRCSDADPIFRIVSFVAHVDHLSAN